MDIVETRLKDRQIFKLSFTGTSQAMNPSRMEKRGIFRFSLEQTLEIGRDGRGL